MPEAPAAPLETEPDGLDDGASVATAAHTVLAVRRRLGGRWSLGLVGLVLILHGGGLLFERLPAPSSVGGEPEPDGGGLLFGWSLTRTVLELIYPNRDLPGLETRDLGWAAMFLIVGALLVVWTSVRLVSRRPIVRGDRDGLGLAVRGPFRGPITIPWREVAGVSATTVTDDYGDVPALLIRLADPSRIGPNPWGASWVEPSTLSVSAPDWEQDPHGVADRLREVAALDTRLPPEETGPDPAPPAMIVDPAPDVPLGEGDA